MKIFLKNFPEKSVMAANIQDEVPGERKSNLNIIRVDSVILGGSDRPPTVNISPYFEVLHRYGVGYPVYRCKGCDKPLFIHTFYDCTELHFDEEEYDVTQGLPRKGRTIICGSINPESIIYCQQNRDRRRSRDPKYCGLCSESKILMKSKDNKWNYYHEMEHPFKIIDYQREIEENKYEVEQDHIEQLNCPRDCDGRCLINIFSEYVDRNLHSPLFCSLCGEVTGVSITRDIENYMDYARKGVYPESFPYVIVCGGFLQRSFRTTPINRCYECDSSLLFIIDRGVMSKKMHFDKHGREENDFEGNDFEGDEPEGDDFEGDDFEEDDFEEDDFEGNDFEGNDFEGNDLGRNDFEGNDLGRNDLGRNDFEGNDFEGNDLGGNGPEENEIEDLENKVFFMRHGDFVSKIRYQYGSEHHFDKRFIVNISKDCLGGGCRGECLQSYIKSDVPTHKSCNKQ